MKIGLVQLGCPKNLVDAEVMLGRLAADGHQAVGEGDGADALIVNTCGFIDAAKQESVNAILSALEKKRRGEVKKVIVTGCLAQRYAAELAKEMPDIDGLMGLNEVEAVTGFLEKPKVMREMQPAEYLLSDLSPRIRATPKSYGYMKISEGCDNPCGFCAIPKMRGRHRSRPVASLVMEAKAMAIGGIREAILISQDTTDYGSDWSPDGKPRLIELIEALDRVNGLDWVRLMYTWPYRFPVDLMKAYADSPKVLNYVDVPLQHIEGGVLTQMKRGGDEKRIKKLIDDLRRHIPDVVIRTTFIVGHPGEGEKEFRALLDFLEFAQFDRAGVFTYSPEEGTTGFVLGDPVPQSAKEERKDAFMAAQSAILGKKLQKMVGQTLAVNVDGFAAEADLPLLTGRYYGQAPEIDGCVILNDCDARSGDLVNVRVESVFEENLIARPL
jgi:ribosomal protein S12 methylthiotransferase